MNPPRLPADNGFELFRWVAALTVVVSHFCVLTRTALPVVPPTSEAVQFFFILSGALTYCSYSVRPGALAFYRRRARRILPAYWGTVAFCVLVGVLFTEMPLRRFFAEADTWRYVGWNAVMLNRLQPTLPGVFADHANPVMDGSLWTMKYEVAFYLLLPLLVFLLRKTGRKSSLVVLYALLTLVQLALFVASHYLSGATLRLLATRGVAQAVCFVAGMAVCEFYPWLSRYRRIALPVALVLAALSYWWWPLRVVWPAVFATSVILLGTATRALGWTRRLPSLTYELFLIHFPVVHVVVEAGVPQRLGVPGAFALCLGLSLLLAYLLRELVKPITCKR
ncbi:MAG: acyltransferase [Bacteroidaceae bacterium]|nr:acyltransferase [Bacteroidaceae bacterium]